MQEQEQRVAPESTQEGSHGEQAKEEPEVYIQKSFSSGYKEHSVAEGGSTLKSKDTLSGNTFVGRFERRCDRQKSGNSLQREGRVAGGNLGSTSGVCEAKRRSRNSPIFSIRIMYRRSRGRVATQGNKTFLWE
jgi:hypothetical protein